MLVSPLANVLAAMLVAAAPSSSGGDERWRFPGRAEAGANVVWFKPHGLSSNAVRSARLEAGGRSRRVPRSRLVHGLSDGALGVRLGKAWRREEPRGRVWLVVRTRKFGEFDGYSSLGGALRRNWDSAYRGSSSIEAAFRRGGGGFARAWKSVSWREGDQVSYRIALRIPSSAHWCYWNPVRWDNYGRYGPGGDVGGVRIQQGELSLIRARYGGVEETLTEGVPVPRDRWFTVTVRQRLSAGPGASNEVVLDGRTVATSSSPNTHGRPVETVRFGAVSVAGSCSGPGAILFDDVSADPR
jgi:hypothetical protein